MTDLDSFPCTVKGPLATTNSRLVTFARVIVRDGRLFVAEGTKRGGEVRSVTEYPAPEGEPVPNPRQSQGYIWGEWSWKSCGCSSQWSKHPATALIAQAEPLVSDATEPDLTPDVAVALDPDASGSLTDAPVEMAG